MLEQKRIFRYLVSGPLTKTNSSKPKNPSHVTKIICKQDNCLNEKVNRFWNHHPIEISHEETSRYDKFIDNIRLENDRYSVAFSFKENRPMVADNYLFCRNLLQKLKERLNKTPQLRKEYNDKYLIVGIIEKVKNEGILG